MHNIVMKQIQRWKSPTKTQIIVIDVN